MGTKKSNGLTKSVKLTGFLLLIDLVLVAVYAYFAFTKNCLPLDQHMSTLCSTLVAVVITMFGLSAASYAFVCSELRAEEKSKPYLSQVLKQYFDKMWALFVASLWLSAVALCVCVICLVIAQKISTENLLTFSSDHLTVYLFDHQYTWLSVITFVSCVFSLTSIIVMLVFNYYIFQRESSYSKIANKMRAAMVSRYSILETELENDSFSDNEKNLGKINNLEKLIDRIVKNHEDMGKTYNSEERGDGLIRNLFLRKLNDGYLSNGEGNYDNRSWESIEDGIKRKDQWDVCCCVAKKNKKWFEEREEDNVRAKAPCDTRFTTVYDDLICYRDTVLVSASNLTNDGAKAAACLRKSIKKRLLAFMMWGESFSNMDLSRMSLSGGDFQNSDFSHCDLTYTRMKGAYCKDADFSEAKMPGMFFEDVSGCDGEIEVTCIDDSKDKWDPYHGKEASYFAGATFARADVSRACLFAKGTCWDEAFPFVQSSKEKPYEKTLFSLENTSFDYAKLYSSRFSNLSFDRANLQKALVFNSIWFQCSAEKTGFEGATMTNSIVICCNFHGSNMNEILFPGSILYRNDFRGALLRNANFSDSNIYRCNFSNSYCQNASFSGMIHDKDTVFKSVYDNKLDGRCIQDDSEECCVDFSYATLTNTDFSGAELSYTNFSYAIGTNCIFTNAEGYHTEFSKALLSSSIFNKTHLVHGNFESSVLRDSVFMGCIFDKCKLTDSDLSKAIFLPGDEAMFKDSKLDRVDFSDTRGLTPSFFDNSTLRGCDFRGSGITKRELNKAGIYNRDCIFANKGRS